MVPRVAAGWVDDDDGLPTVELEGCPSSTRATARAAARRTSEEDASDDDDDEEEELAVAEA